MSNWTTILTADLQEARAAALVTALTTKALGAGQPDPMPGTIAKITDEVRAAIAFSGRHVLDATPGSVPNSLKDLAVQAVLRRMKSRLMMELTDQEREEERTYQKRLEQLISGRWPIEKADTPISEPTVQSGSSVQVISSTSSRVTGKSMQGF